MYLSRTLTGTEEIRIYYTGTVGTELIALNATTASAAHLGWVRFRSGEKTLTTGTVKLVLYQNYTAVGSTLDVYVSNPKLLRKATKSLEMDQLAATKQVAKFYELPDGDTTPDITGRSYCVTANTGSTAYSDFDGAAEGDLLELLIDDTYTTVTHNSNIVLAGATNFSPSSGGALTLRRRGSQWKEISRTTY